MKKLLFAGLIASAGLALRAADAAAPAAAEKPEGEQAELTERSDKPWSVGLDVPFYTAYVWRNALSSDRPIAQPILWGRLEFLEILSLGGYVAQNYDLTNRRRHSGYRGEWNEHDYGLYLGVTAWQSDDEAEKLKFEFGNEWYTYNIYGEWDNGARRRKSCPTTYELYVKSSFENPFVTPYVQCSWEVMSINGFSVNGGLQKTQALSDLFESEDELLSRLSWFFDWNVNGGSGKYLSFLYSPRYSTYRGDDGEEYYDTSMHGHGIGGTTFKVGLSYAPCDNFSIGLVGAYTAILNERVGESVRAAHDLGGGPDCLDHEQLVWGGIEMHLTF